MSSNQWVNYGIGIVVGVVVAYFVGPVAGYQSFAAIAGLSAGSITASYLNGKYATPRATGGGLGRGIMGRSQTNGVKDAASQALSVNASSEAVSIPVPFGRVRVPGNFLRYDASTFRVVPIVERVQRDPAAVAYDQAKKTYDRNPHKVDHELDVSARKAAAAQGGGGKGGGSPEPPQPSSGSSGTKIGQYAQYLLEKDQSGGKALPKEYDEYIVGYRYYLSWELGFCMGPVDNFLALWTYPGEARVITNTGVGAVPDNDYVFAAAGPDQGGSVRFYPGRTDQTRNAGDVYVTDHTNYRGTCFAVFSDFYMGQRPAPPSFAAEVQRFPVCLNSAGDVIAGMKTRGAALPSTVAAASAAWAAGVLTVTTTDFSRYTAGGKIVLAGFTPSSLNAEWTVLAASGGTVTITMANPGAITAGTTRPRAHSSYDDANPAAILYEILTNKVWGRGLSPDELDEDSFVTASEWCEENSVGMSFVLETQNVLSDAVELIRNHLSMILVPVGGVVRCRILLDRTNAYDPVIQLNSDQVQEPVFSRPAWPSTVNELRVEFTNIQNNYQPEICLVQDDGNIATVGRINSDRLSLPAFSNRDTAERMSRFLLGMMSSPLATLAFTMNRFETRLAPGDFVQFVWNEWSAGTSTTFWRVVEITDGEKNDTGIKVILSEDMFATPLETAPDGDFVPPVPAYEGRVTNTDSDLYLGEDTRLPYSAGEITFQIHELNIRLADAEPVFFVTAQRTEGRTSNLKLYWREDGSADDFISLGTVQPWAIHGVLKTTISATGRTTERGASYVLQLEQASERARFLEYCAVCPTDADELDRVTGSETNWLIIGGELFIIAMAEAGGAADEVIITAWIRGQYGTDKAAHAIDDPVAFIYQFIPRVYTLRSDRIQVETPLEFRAEPLSYDGQVGDALTEVATLADISRKPLAVTRWQAAELALDWTVAVWPRFHNRGADSVGDWQQVVSVETREIPYGYEFWVEPLDAMDASLGPVEKLTVVYVPDAAPGTDPTAGRITFDYLAPASTVALKFHQSYNGILGIPTIITA